MIWLFAAIIPPFLWAFVNHTDKYLLSKTRHKSSVEVLMVYSTLFSLIVLPFLFYFSYANLFSSGKQIAVQFMGGILLTLSIYFYLMALKKDEASVVSPFFLLVPVFGYIFSYFLLGEVLTSKQIIACMLIIFGALILSLEFEEERKIRVRHGVLLFMTLSVMFQAGQETLFKFVTIENSLAVSFFWLHVGIAVSGFALLAFKRNLFGEFVDSLKVNGRLMLWVNFGSETVSSIAYLIRNYALLLAPIAVIMTLNGYQPVFVFILGIVLTILYPRFVTEKIRLVHLFHKGIAIAVILAGTILITQTL